MADDGIEPGRPPRTAAGPGRLWLVGLTSLLLGAAWLATIWVPGQQASPDSAMYLDAARNLARGEGYVTARVLPERTGPAPISAWPPVFPLLLAAGMQLGLDGGQAASLVLFLAFLSFAGLSFALVILASDRRWWPLALALGVPVLLHPATLRSLDAILADLPFAAFATAVVCTATSLAGKDEPSPRAVFGFGLLAGATVLVRWAGVYWVAPVALGLLAAQGRALPTAATWRRALAFALGFGALVVPWFVRNLVLTGSLAGSRRALASSPLAAAGDAAEGVFAALTRVAQLPPALVAVALAALAVAGLASRGWRDRALAPLLAVALGYPALMVASWSLSPFDPLSRERFWLPLWPVGAALFVATLARCAGRRVLVTTVALAGFVLAGPATLSFARAAGQQLPLARRATGLASPVWASSAPVRFFRESEPECAVVASEPRVLLLHASLPVVYVLPTTLEELSPLLERQRALCIVTFSLRASGTAEKRSAAHRALLQELAATLPLRRVAGDRVGAVWLTESGGS